MDTHYISTMTLTDLTKTPPSGQALLRVYPGQLTLNSAARELLGLTDDSQVAFRIDSHRYVYVGRKTHSAYKLAKVGKAYRVRSTALCKSLADVLQGYGTYRIENENPARDFSGDICYPVFFRKYDNK